MTEPAWTDPMGGPDDDRPTPKPGPPKKVSEKSDGSEWIPIPEPAEGEGPLP
jgi:hypothetical protein